MCAVCCIRVENVRALAQDSPKHGWNVLVGKLSLSCLSCRKDVECKNVHAVCVCVCGWVGAYMLMYICGCVWAGGSCVLGVGVGVGGCTVRVCTCACLHMGELWIHPLVVDALAFPYTARL